MALPQDGAHSFISIHGMQNKSHAISQSGNQNLSLKSLDILKVAGLDNTDTYEAGDSEVALQGLTV